MIVPLYITEIAPPHLRGALGCCNQLFICIGVLVVNVLALPIVNNLDWWRTLLYLSLIPALLQFVPTLLFGPESPRWLLANERPDEACTSNCDVSSNAVSSLTIEIVYSDQSNSITWSRMEP